MTRLPLSVSAARGTALMLALLSASAIAVVWQIANGTTATARDARTTETITGVGSSTGNGKGGGNNGNGGGNVAGSVTPPAKTFEISGSIDGLAPTVRRQLVLTVTNPNNQTIRVTSLRASVSSIAKAADAPPGSCADIRLVQVGSWTGSAFEVAARQTRQIDGHIPLTLSNDAGDGCQGARISLTYSGSASQP